MSIINLFSFVRREIALLALIILAPFVVAAKPNCVLVTHRATPLLAMLASVPKVRELTTSGLVATPVSASSVRLSWNHWGGTGAYNVRVCLSSGIVVQQFSTVSNSTIVSGLAPGTGYHFEVEKTSYIIVTDLIP